MSDELNRKLPIWVWTIGGAMTLHIMKSWPAKKICNSVDDECVAWSKQTGHTMLAIGIDVLPAFEPRLQPVRSFERDARGKWVEIKPRHYSEAWHDARERAFKDAIDKAAAELGRESDEATNG